MNKAIVKLYIYLLLHTVFHEFGICFSYFLTSADDIRMSWNTEFSDESMYCLTMALLFIFFHLST